MRRHLAVLAALAIASGLLTAVAEPASALNLVVDDPGDGVPNANDCTPVNNACSLRDAIEAANASPEADVITLPEGEITLTYVGSGEELNQSGDLDVEGETTFIGAGPDLTVIQQDVISAQKDRNFDLHGDSTEPVTFQSLTIQYGFAPAADGGGIRTVDQDVTLEDVILRENLAQTHGGGIASDSADVTGTDLLFDGNVAGEGAGTGNGGGIYDRFGDVNIDPSQFYLNSADNGGGIYTEDGDVFLLDVTMNENSALLNGGAVAGVYMANQHFVNITRSVLYMNSASDGGAVYLDGDNAQLMVVNSTLSGNEVSGQGGAIHNDSTVNLVHATLFHNRSMDSSSANSIFNQRVVTVTNSILTDQEGPNCAGNTGAIASVGVNLVTDLTCNSSEADMEALPRLEPLADNGGPTLTHALRADSPAIDAAGFDVCGSETSSVQEDQRGVERPIGLSCDIGAFEAPLPDIDLSVTPESATNLIGTEHTIQIELTSMLSPVGGRSLYVRVDAADPEVDLPQYGVTVDDDGHAEFSYDSHWTGTDTITVFLDLDGDGQPGPDDPTEVVTKEWTPIGRFFGVDRLLTAVDVSQDLFADDEADVVVLARADDFADALAGTPLAIEKNGPMLLTFPAELHEAAADEIERVLPDDATVFLLGATNALSAAVESAVQALGFETERIEGPTRIETSVAVNEAFTDYDTLLITTGYDFPDALAAGAAAAYSGGAVVLTTAEVPHPATTAFLKSRPDFDQYAIGGPAARAYPDAAPVLGPSREETAVAVAEEFFRTDPETIGLARRDVFADALTGGVHAVFYASPMLLTPSDQLHPAVAAYICAHEIAGAYLYGGTAALSQDVEDQVGDALSGEGCNI